jgi:hypothetical protein
MKTASRAGSLMVALALGACSKGDDSTPPLSASHDASAATPSFDAAATAPKAAADAGPTLTGSWTGKYTAAPGSFYMPEGPEWSNLHFRGEDAGAGLGDGTMAVAVDAIGRVSGTLDGALGALTINGVFDGEAFAAAIVSSDPNQGFAGTVVGRRAGNRVSGTIRAALPTGNVLREAPFTLDRRP